MPYLPYEEPGTIIILSLTSFLLLLNGVRYLLDRLLYCGLIGEILIGIIWGLPVGGTSWLHQEMQQTIQAFGYLGLIGLVFEGGLNSDVALLKKTAYMSISVATIGLLMPIALSFILLLLPFPSSSGTAHPTPLAAFSAGASLCSTSLGTTFAILSSTGMQKTKVGVVLVGAAMMDDVVGLVMVNIVTTLGHGSIGAWPIARPIVASFGLLLMTMIICSYLIKPVRTWIMASPVELVDQQSEPKRTTARKLMDSIPHLGFMLSTAVLVIFVTIASYIDASVLFSAFIAGGVVSYLWGVGPEGESTCLAATGMYDQYFKSVMDYVLVPFFFASIGFSIPITNMFAVSILWKGFAYAALMAVAKGLVGIVIYFDFIPKALDAIPAQPLTSINVDRNKQKETTTSPKPNPPHMIAALIACAMVARGEIGFLIASLSQSSGTLVLRYDENPLPPNDEIFLVIVWAIVLCTIAGPVGVGIIVRRLRRPENATHFSNWM